MSTNVNCPPKKTVQKTLALTPARALALAGGATGSSEFVGHSTRPREGRKGERRRLPVRGRSWPGPLRRPRGPCGVGSRPPRSPGPGPAEHCAEARAAPAGGPSVSPPRLQTGLCSREDASFLSRTLPSTLRPGSSPTSSPEDRSPCRGVHSDDHRAPRRAGGRRQAWPSGAQLPTSPPPRAQRARRKVVGGHLDPRPPPEVPLACPAESGRGGRGGARPGSGITASSARPAMRLGLPWGRRLASHRSARGQRPDGRAGRPIVRCHGQHLPFIGFYTCPLHVRRIWWQFLFWVFFFFLILAAPPRRACPLIGHLLFICPLKAATAK